MKDVFLDLSALDSLNIPPDQKEILKGRLIAQNNAEVSQFNKEFSRYKQDCRKKALDIAERTVTQAQSGEVSEAITREADKYYNWLISIPEK